MFTRKPQNRRREECAPRFTLSATAWKRLGLIGAAGTAAVAVGVVLVLLLNQPIEAVSVHGHFQRVSAQDIEKVVRGRLRGAGLLGVDLRAIGRGLRALPWIDRVAVQRAWPQGLIVTVEEQNAVASWNGHGLLNARGELFLADTRFMPPELPRLSGPLGTEGAVTARYLAEQGRLVEAGMRLVALGLDERGSWEFTLDGGVRVRLGARDPDERFDRFLSAATRIVSERAQEIDYVDMRYSNGFAIGWRTGATHLAGGSASEDGKPDG